MAEYVAYGLGGSRYTFPTPTPLVSLGVDTVYIGGVADHYSEEIGVVGTLTGENLSGIHLQKMQMISGLLSEYQTLYISNQESTDGVDPETAEKVKIYTCSTPSAISFGASDLTTTLPYSVTFNTFSSASFSEFFGVAEPTDNWTFTEQDGRVTEVQHSVSARGVKVNSQAPLQNARDFVTGRATGCLDISLFQTGQSDKNGSLRAFLVSRNEDIDKTKNRYSLQETFQYSTSQSLYLTGITSSGILSCDTKISYEKDQGLNIQVEANVKGGIVTGAAVGLIDTGLFTPDQATQVAINAVKNSTSSFESGCYTFVDRGPKTISYDVDTGSNSVSFKYSFADPDNLEQQGNVMHKRSSSVDASKDDSKIRVSVNGELNYNGPFDVLGTGDPATGERFKQVNARFSGVAANSGFLNLAIEALDVFTGDATGYHISGNFLNPEPLDKTINKIPAESKITYAVSFDNRVDLSSGTLSGLKVSIKDKKPLEISGIVPSLVGFAKQKIYNRRAGEINVSATCEADTGSLQNLIDVASGHITGIFPFAESSSLNEQTISYNMSRYY